MKIIEINMSLKEETFKRYRFIQIDIDTEAAGCEEFSFHCETSQIAPASCLIAVICSCSCTHLDDSLDGTLITAVHGHLGASHSTEDRTSHGLYNTRNIM